MLYFRDDGPGNTISVNRGRCCAVALLVETFDNGPKRAQVTREIGDRFLEGVEAVLEGVGDRGRHG